MLLLQQPAVLLVLLIHSLGSGFQRLHLTTQALHQLRLLLKEYTHTRGDEKQPIRHTAWIACTG